MRRLSLIVCCAFLGSAQSVREASIDRIVEEARRAWQAPGIAVAVVQNDRVVYLKAFGVKRLGGDERVTPDTRMAIGSTTKAFTTTAMAILVDDKKMDWDDPASKHLPGFRLADPLANENVVLRDLVTHRTGLTRHDQLWYGTPWGRDEILRRIGLVPLSKPFRTAYQYQNIMFLAAGQAVGHASGTSWETFVRARILEPLGMSNTDFSTAEVVKAPDAATPHVKKPDGAVMVLPWRNIDNIAPAGSINSSARDLARWVRLHLNEGTFEGKRIVSEKQLHETHLPQMVIQEETQTRELNPETNISVYGMGWRLQDYRGRHLISHGGAIDGFRAQVAFLPKEKVGMAILTNLGGNNLPEALRFALVDDILDLPPREWNKLYLEAAAKQEAEQKKRRGEAEEKRFKGTKPSRELAAYAGKYEHPAYGTLEVAVDGDRLAAAWGGQKKVLRHFHFDTFETIPADWREEPATLLFRLGREGAPSGITFQGQDFGRAK